MNKDEILSKSRKEHRDRDLFKDEIEMKAGSAGLITATVLATVFFVVQLALGQGFNYGLYAILFAVGAAQFTLKAVRLQSRRETLLAVLYSLVALALSAAHLYSLTAGVQG